MLLLFYLDLKNMKNLVFSISPPKPGNNLMLSIFIVKAHRVWSVFRMGDHGAPTDFGCRCEAVFAPASWAFLQRLYL
jgi:hypothetical protein